MGIRISTKATIALVLLAFLSTAFFAQEDHRHRRFDPKMYERPGRDEYQKPEQVVQELKLKRGDVVADIGAGSGYFTRRFGAAVATNGVVYAVDIDEAMLRHIHQSARELKQQNVVTVLAAEDDPMLPLNAVDLVFVCNTNHHINNRTEYYKRVARSLKAGGRLAIVDYYKKALPVGPPPDEKLSREQVIQEITAAGFKLQQELSFLPYQYFLIFIR